MCTKFNSPDIKASALELIGNTPLVALDRIWSGPGRLLAKCEFVNPGGSIKDRAASKIITEALENGELKPGAPVMEMTSGNTGSGLGVVCAVLGHPLTVFMSKGNDPQRAVMIRGLGANVELVEQVDGSPGNVTLADITVATEKCKELVRNSGAFYVDQFNNDSNWHSHVATTGPEIWRQTGERVDAFVACVGTSGTFMGVSKYLKSVNADAKCYAVEPEGSQPIKGCDITNARHMLQGSGYGHVPNFFEHDIMEDTISVTDEEAVEYRQLLAKKEGLYLGYTSGANVAAAVKLLKKGNLGDDPWVVTVLVDNGLKYADCEESK